MPGMSRNGVNFSAEQVLALHAYLLPGRRVYVEQEMSDRLHGGPVHVAIGYGGERVAEAEIDERGHATWKGTEAA